MRLIVDTDFGDDIDDSFALAYLLCRADSNVELVLSSFGDTQKRAELVADFLRRCGRTDIPVGVGVKSAFREPYMYPLVRPESLEAYPRAERDGIGRAIDIIMSGPEPVTVVAIGPFTNIAEILRRCPEAGGRMRVAAMAGSIRRGYFGAEHPDAEYNIASDPDSFKKVVSECPQTEITPLDTCGSVFLSGEDFSALLSSPLAPTAALTEDFAKWLTLGFFDRKDSTSCLYDVVAAYMAFGKSFLEYETLPVSVRGDGMLSVVSGGIPVTFAAEWSDFGGFINHLIGVYTGIRGVL